MAVSHRGSDVYRVVTLQPAPRKQEAKTAVAAPHGEDWWSHQPRVAARAFFFFLFQFDAERRKETET